MIKCTYFSKLLKQSLFTLLIGFFGFGLGSFVNGAYEWSFYNVDSSYPVGADTSFSFRPISSSTTILEGGGMTESKPLIYNYNKIGTKNYTTLYFWGLDSVLYSCENPYNSQTDKNCFIVNNFCKYNGTEFTGDAYGNLCRNGTIVSSGSVYNDSSLKGEMTQIAFLTYNTSFSQSSNSNVMCFVYGRLGFSLCYKNSTVSPNYYAISTSIAGSSLNPVEFNKDIIGTSPWVSGSSGGTGNITGPTESIDSTFTGDYTYFECTYNSIIEHAESVGYSPYLCRGGLNDFSTGVMTDISTVNPGTGKRLDEIYGQTKTSEQSAIDWFQYWQNVYQNPYVYQNSIWLNQPAVLRTYFTFYNQYGGVQWNFNDVYEYCLLKKFVSWNPIENGDTVYKGQYFKKTCEFLKNGGWSAYGGNGEHGVGTNWDGIGDFSGTTNQDGITFIQNFFNDLKANWFTFDKSDLGLGFLPTYIITFLLAIIFFRFLSH